MKKVLLLYSFVFICLCSASQSGVPNPCNMERFTVYNFSQHWNLTVTDDQVFQTLPDMIIRGWCQWNNWGTKPSDFNFDVIRQYHENNICFIGGVTASVYFYDQANDSALFKDMVTRDAANRLVPHNVLGQGAYRGNIANPAYRDYVIKMAKIQIDGGAGGIFFDEVISGYDGLKYDGNEGFDDYTLKDFNEFLAEKYPDYSKADWIKKFGMTESNYINSTLALSDLERNFNYRRYLAENRWTDNPLTSANPLAKEWGKVLNNRADTASGTFLARYTTLYWKDMVSQLRNYAKEKYDKDIYITANGIFPYVDFNSLGMYNGNRDNYGLEVNYVPVKQGHLDGRISLQPVFQSLYTKSRNVSGKVPVVLFIDWPTNTMNDYYNLPLDEKMDYWKIYAAEAYANGLFMAFHLRTSMPEDPTAAEQGTLGFLTRYGNFYRKNESLYHNNQIVPVPINNRKKEISYSMMHYPESGSYSLHLVNHSYIPGKGIAPVKNLSVALNFNHLPKMVQMVSPDFEGTRTLIPDFKNKILTLNIDSLSHYNVILIKGQGE